ncbi:serine hydrolase [Poritiphilus flavus]|uniref:Serine hydrolase n=1 Tax=Poritiphilus flavus TaxID=2697053 RepID=A0A6L9EH49_9FLAO|nr:serine hydrolase [Poritiphilus flavus]NAS14084.1 serine hydrolase [Poritiphilus flavus]
MNKLIFALIAISIISCTNQKSDSTSVSRDFEEDMLQLKEYFHIPGLAILVKKDGKTLYENYFGYADLETQQPLDSTSMFPIASITKTFSAVLLQQLVEEGKLDLEEPINLYLEGSSLSDSIKIKHVLSHTSEGEPGSFFNYSSRFFLLTRVIEKSASASLVELMNSKIIDPLNLKNTVPLIDQTVIAAREDQLAKPYYFYGEVEAGHYDSGLSAASGLASTLRDLARFDNALDSDQLISGESKNQMFSPFNSDLAFPYGYGIFTQNFTAKEIKWGYGQEDCFSSLLLKVPEDNITLILLANNNLMSDPPRLINGDLSYSRFALSFLKHFVFELPETYKSMDYTKPESLDIEQIQANPDLGKLYRQELLANAIAASFMGQVDSLELQRSKELTEIALREFPDYAQYGNQSLMRLLMVLANFGGYDEFDEAFVDLGNLLLEKNQFDPYTNVYLGYYYQNRNQAEKAFQYFNTIAETPNLQPFWYSIEAFDFLGDYYKNDNPELARTYYQKIVDIGWNMGGKLDKAKTELERL